MRTESKRLDLKYIYDYGGIFGSKPAELRAIALSHRQESHDLYFCTKEDGHAKAMQQLCFERV